VAGAVFRVLASRGFTGLTLRAVGAEIGASTGVVTHYFSSKAELVEFALAMLEQSVAERSRPPSERGLPALRTAVRGMLPLTTEAATINRVWISSWDVALSEPTLTAAYARMYAESRSRLEQAVRDAQELGDMPPGDASDAAAALHAFILGVVVQTVLDPEAFPATRQVELTDSYLERARKGAPNGTVLGTDLRR
jgi:AcrR family transcriptional regulator